MEWNMTRKSLMGLKKCRVVRSRAKYSGVEFYRFDCIVACGEKRDITVDR